MMMFVGLAHVRGWLRVLSQASRRGHGQRQSLYPCSCRERTQLTHGTLVTPAASAWGRGRQWQRSLVMRICFQHDGRAAETGATLESNSKGRPCITFDAS